MIIRTDSLFIPNTYNTHAQSDSEYYPVDNILSLGTCAYERSRPFMQQMLVTSQFLMRMMTLGDARFDLDLPISLECRAQIEASCT